MKKLFKIIFAPITLPFSLTKKTLKSSNIERKNHNVQKKPKTAKAKTWTLIAIWSFVSIGISAIILDSIFGLTIDGQSKDITVAIGLFFTIATSILIYKYNPYSMVKKEKRKRINASEKTDLIKTENIIENKKTIPKPSQNSNNNNVSPIRLKKPENNYNEPDLLEKHNISEKRFNKALNFYNRPIFKKQLNPILSEDLYTIESKEFKILNDLGLVTQETNYPYMITINDNRKDIDFAIKFFNYEKNRSIFIPKLDRFDDLEDGFEFENFIAELLLKLNYEKIEVLQRSNDYGADVLAEKNGTKYAIQCKYYSETVGITAVQEIIGGAKHHNAHVPIVATNNTFTRNADELAKSNNVVLWDRQQLLKMITETNI